jgi:hypothetical protein
MAGQRSNRGTALGLLSHFLMTDSIYRLYGYQDRSTTSFHSPSNGRIFNSLKHRCISLPARIYVGRALVHLEYYGNHQEEEVIYIRPRLQVRITGPRRLLPRCARQPAVKNYRGRKYVHWNGGLQVWSKEVHSLVGVWSAVYVVFEMIC